MRSANVTSTVHKKQLDILKTALVFHHMLKGSEGTAAVRSRARAQVFD